MLCSDICVPTPGSYYCKCRDGFTLLDDGKTCSQDPSDRYGRNTDSCFRRRILRRPRRRCCRFRTTDQSLNQPYTHFLFLKYIFLIDDNLVTSSLRSRRCKSTHPCEQICTDNGEAVICSCNPGYDLADDGRSCIQKTTKNKKSTEAAENVSSPLCPSGYRYNAVKQVCDGTYINRGRPAAERVSLFGR